MTASRNHRRLERARRAGLYLGLINDRTRPTVRQSSRAMLLALPVLLILAVAAVLAEQAGAPGWLSFVVVTGAPGLVFGVFLERVRRSR